MHRKSSAESTKKPSAGRRAGLGQLTLVSVCPLVPTASVTGPGLCSQPAKKTYFFLGVHFKTWGLNH